MLEVESSGFEADPLQAFLDVEARVCGEHPVWRALPKQDPRPLLRPQAPFFAQGGEHRLFVVRRDGDAVGRVAAMRSPRLVEPDPAGGSRPVGLVGLFECADDVEVARALLAPALAWLRAGPAGARRVLGPMNFSTWYRYRFVTEGHEKGPFLLEPWNPPHYAALLLACGFVPFNRYATLRLPHAPVPLLEASHRRCERAGVRFEPLDLTHAASALPLFHALSTRIFAGKTAYSAITLPEFQALYAHAGSLLEPGLSWLARDRAGEPIGFLFAYPDLLEPMRTGGKVETTVLKTIGAVDDAPAGLGWALVHRHIEAAAAKGYRFGLYALMEKYEELLRYAQRASRTGAVSDLGEVWKEYALFVHEPPA